MSNTVSIRYMFTGNIFDKIKYNTFNDLSDKLKSLVLKYDSDILIKLLINDETLNYFEDVIKISILLNLNEDTCISVIFIDKKILYCLNNENGIYILDFYWDKYSKLLNTIIEFYENESYNLIMNISYKDLVLKAIKKNGLALEYASVNLQNDKEVVLKAIKQNEFALEYASVNLQNDKEVVLKAIKQNEFVLKYASINLQNDKEFIIESINAGCTLTYINDIFLNDKEVMLEAVKKNGKFLDYASINLKNNKEIVLEAVKQNGIALKFASSRLKKNKIIVLEAVKQSSNVFIHINTRLKKDKDIILEYNNHI